jgi:hypothetical protein
MANSEMAMSAATRSEPFVIASAALAKMASTTNDRPTNFLQLLRSAFDGRRCRDVRHAPIQSRMRWNAATSAVIRVCSTSEEEPCMSTTVLCNGYASPKVSSPRLDPGCTSPAVKEKALQAPTRHRRAPTVELTVRAHSSQSTVSRRFNRRPLLLDGHTAALRSPVVCRRERTRTNGRDGRCFFACLFLGHNLGHGSR